MRTRVPLSPMSMPRTSAMSLVVIPSGCSRSMRRRLLVVILLLSPSSCGASGSWTSSDASSDAVVSRGGSWRSSSGSCVVMHATVPERKSEMPTSWSSKNQRSMSSQRRVPVMLNATLSPISKSGSRMYALPPTTCRWHRSSSMILPVPMLLTLNPVRMASVCAVTRIAGLSKTLHTVARPITLPPPRCPARRRWGTR